MTAPAWNLTADDFRAAIKGTQFDTVLDLAVAFSKARDDYYASMKGLDECGDCDPRVGAFNRASAVYLQAAEDLAFTFALHARIAKDLAFAFECHEKSGR